MGHGLEGEVVTIGNPRRYGGAKRPMARRRNRRQGEGGVEYANNKVGKKLVVGQMRERLVVGAKRPASGLGE